MAELVTTSHDPRTTLAFSIDRAATALSVSPRMIRNLISSGQLRVAKIGRRVVIPIEQLHKLIAVAQ